MAEEKKKVISKKEVVVTLPVVKAPAWLQGFIDFIREQGVVGLAVGFILAFAAKGLVDSLVNNIVNPLIGLLYGGGNLAEKSWCLKSAAGKCTSPMGYGAFLNTFVNFLLLVAVVYFLVKGLKLDKLDKPKDK